MKKNKLIVLLLFGCLSLSACQSIHTGKVVIDETKNSTDEKLNVEYIIVDEEDKDSLIKNIKSGRGAVVDRAKVSNRNDEVEENEETRGNVINGENNQNNNGR